jgi:hypothetical protein
MGTSGKADLPRTVAGLLLGGVGLWLANQVIQPVPLTAGGAYAAGAVILLARWFRTLRTGYVALAAFAGALPAIAVHRKWHLEGFSPDPGGGLWPHVLGEGLLGLCVALVCLGIAAWVARHTD